tara:strand:- start:2289 stop:2453 length:165 start_codon:yes stop_codon:yes gene_type:complete
MYRAENYRVPGSVLPASVKPTMCIAVPVAVMAENPKPQTLPAKKNSTKYSPSNE